MIRAFGVWQMDWQAKRTEIETKTCAVVKQSSDENVNYDFSSKNENQETVVNCNNKCHPMNDT